MPTRKQCTKCPWKVSTDPHDIPNGYCEQKHADLENTIADPGRVDLGIGLRMMACHETKPGQEVFCVGWFDHQMNEGNNIGLRMACATGGIDYDVETVGVQHKCFEDTLPQGTD